MDRGTYLTRRGLWGPLGLSQSEGLGYLIPERKRAKSANALFLFDPTHGEVYCLSPIDWVQRLLLVKAIERRAAIDDKSLHTSWNP